MKNNDHKQNQNLIPIEKTTTTVETTEPVLLSEPRKNKFNNKTSLETQNEEELMTIADKQFDFQKSIMLLNKRPFIGCFDSLTWFIDRMKQD